MLGTRKRRFNWKMCAGRDADGSGFFTKPLINGRVTQARKYGGRRHLQSQVIWSQIHRVPERLPAPKLMPESAEPVDCYLIARQFRRHRGAARIMSAYTLSGDDDGGSLASKMAYEMGW